MVLETSANRTNTKVAKPIDKSPESFLVFMLFFPVNVINYQEMIVDRKGHGRIFNIYLFSFFTIIFLFKKSSPINRILFLGW